MTDYRVVYEDPDYPDDPVKILVPSEEWMQLAMKGDLPPIEVYLDLKNDEQKAIDEGRYESFEHDENKLLKQYTAPKIGPLTEEEAIEYLIMKDLPNRIWNKIYNRPMFKIINKNKIPKDRTFRDAWRLAY